MLRKITTHSENSIRFTPRAKEITQQLNEYRRANGEVSLKEMAKIFGLRETNCAITTEFITTNGTSYIALCWLESTLTHSH